MKAVWSASQGRWSCSSALHCEASLGSSASRFGVQERHGAVGVHPEEGHKNDPRDGTPPYEDRLRAGAVLPGGEKALGRPEGSFSVSRGGL